MDVSGGLVSFLQLQGQGPGFHPWAKVAARMLTTANIISSAANLVIAKKQSQGFSIGESCCLSLTCSIPVQQKVEIDNEVHLGLLLGYCIWPRSPSLTPQLYS